MQIILDSFGTSLRRKNGMFEIQNQDGSARRIAANRVEGILVSQGISLSSDVIGLALEHDIDLIFINRRGDILGRVWNNRFGSIASIRKQQALFASTPAGLDWAKNQVFEKINQQKLFLEEISRSHETLSGELQKAVIRLEGVLKTLRQMNAVNHPDLADSLRGWEGTASRFYFEALSQALPETYRFAKRSRRPAKDIFNALLNYLYGILYAQVETALIKAGIDPYLGVWHSDEHNRPVLTYDFIEPYRSWADRVVFGLCQLNTLSQGNLEAQDHHKGVWLDASAKKLATATFYEYLRESVLIHHKRLSRENHLLADARSFAKMLLECDLD